MEHSGERMRNHKRRHQSELLLGNALFESVHKSLSFYQPVYLTIKLTYLLLNKS